MWIELYLRYNVLPFQILGTPVPHVRQSTSLVHIKLIKLVLPSILDIVTETKDTNCSVQPYILRQLCGGI